MAIIKKKETAEFDLDNYYFINKVDLRVPEDEHTHKFIELVYTLSGKGIHKINGKEYHVKGGDMLIVNYHCRHEVIPVQNLSYVDIMLKPEYVNETLQGTEDLFLLLQLRDFSDFSNSVIRDNILISFSAETQRKIEFLLELTTEEQDRTLPAGNLIIYSSLSILLSLVFRKMTEKQCARLELNEHLLEYIRRNCRSRLQVNELAAKCGYTCEHFSRIFKDYFGTSPVEFIGKCRITKAKEMLRDTDKSIDTIICECGFTNRTAFFKKFYTDTGSSPLQYRKNQKRIQFTS